jgi:hypothetical protein
VSGLAALRRFSPRPLSRRRSSGTAFCGRNEPEVSQNNRAGRQEPPRSRIWSLPKRGSDTTLNGALLSVRFFKECWAINIFLTMPPPLTFATRAAISPETERISHRCCGFVRKTWLLHCRRVVSSFAFESGGIGCLMPVRRAAVQNRADPSGRRGNGQPSPVCCGRCRRRLFSLRTCRRHSKSGCLRPIQQPSIWCWSDGEVAWPTMKDD